MEFFRLLRFLRLQKIRRKIRIQKRCCGAPKSKHRRGGNQD